MAGWNNGGNGRLDLDALDVFMTLYEDFRTEKGFPAHRRNMHCPVMLFCSGSYKGRVASCHGPGYPSHQKLNEHLRRQHAPDLANDGKRMAPVLDRTKYNAWKAWLDLLPRTGSVLDENDMQEKWWDTTVILGLQERPKVLPKQAHLASPADEIPFIHAFGRWLRSNRGSMSAAETALSQYLRGYSEGLEASRHLGNQGSISIPQPYASMVDTSTRDDAQTPPDGGAQHSQAENENFAEIAQSLDLFNFDVGIEDIPTIF